MLEETDRILTCSYCRVRLYLVAPDYFRYCLVSKETAEEDIIFAPYWRFRGMEFFSQAYAIRQRVVDTSILATEHSFLPRSLGLRPQALKLRFVSSKNKARFLKQRGFFKEALLDAGTKNQNSAEPSHDRYTPLREFIGESLSLIYSPFMLNNSMLYDAIVKRPVPSATERDDQASFIFEQPAKWDISFVPTLCPQCGWQLEGEKESCMLACTNCDTAWQPSGNCFTRVAHRVGAGKDSVVMHVPFWRMQAAVTGISIGSYADLVRLANLPKAIRREWEAKKIFFWSPAFKIQPHIFLRLSQQMTVRQPEESWDEKLAGLSLYPVTLPVSEAAQGIKVTLVHLIKDKRMIYPLLPDITITIQEYELVYMPFRVTANEFIQCSLGFGIDRNAMKFGKSI